ncbi:fimbrial protein, partial [Aeromonas simiae]
NESSAEGVGIVLSDVMGKTLTLSNGYSRGAGTTELFSISKGEKLESDYNIYLMASYKTFDEKNLVPGTIVATAQVMFSYD